MHYDEADEDILEFEQVFVGNDYRLVDRNDAVDSSCPNNTSPKIDQQQETSADDILQPSKCLFI